MKKPLTIVLAVIAAVAVIVCGVFGSQKADLEKKLPGLTNLNVDVSEENGEIVFLHKIVEGSASKSYGIQVAKLAGVPKELLDNATEKLNEMETREEEMYGDQGHQISFFRTE